MTTSLILTADYVRQFCFPIRAIREIRGSGVLDRQSRQQIVSIDNNFSSSSVVAIRFVIGKEKSSHQKTLK
jgi:hypothetical protein